MSDAPGVDAATPTLKAHAKDFNNQPPSVRVHRFL